MQPAKRTLRDILKTNPKFHRLVDIHSELDDTLTSWAAQIDVLEAMERFLQPKMRTLETGCGQSTIMFGLNQVEHHCVTPAQGEADRVQSFCQETGIDLATVHFLIGGSEDELPRLPDNLHWTWYSSMAAIFSPFRVSTGTTLTSISWRAASW